MLINDYKPAVDRKLLELLPRDGHHCYDLAGSRYGPQHWSHYCQVFPSQAAPLYPSSTFSVSQESRAVDDLCEVQNGLGIHKKNTPETGFMSGSTGKHHLGSPGPPQYETVIKKNIFFISNQGFALHMSWPACCLVAHVWRQHSSWSHSQQTASGSGWSHHRSWIPLLLFFFLWVRPYLPPKKGYTNSQIFNGRWAAPYDPPVSPQHYFIFLRCDAE